MAVPDTSTFTLQDVVDEINPVADSLKQCTIDSLERKFDLNYCGIYPATKLSHFRNYGGFNTIQLSVSGNATIVGACGLPAATDYYTDLRYLPTIGVTIYTNYPANVVLNGGNLYWKYSEGGSFKIGTDGIIDSAHDCYDAITLSSGSATSSIACSDALDTTKYVFIGSSIGVGTQFYNNIDLTTVFNGGNLYYKYGTNQVLKIGTDGIVDTSSACSSSAQRSNTSYSTAALACADPMTSTTTIYYSGALADGNTIYTDAGLTTVFNGGGNGWKIGSTFSCEISTGGVISRENICF